MVGDAGNLISFHDRCEDARVGTIAVGPSFDIDTPQGD